MKGFRIISSKPLLIGTVILTAILFLQLPAQASGQYTKVVTYNLYLGAEIQSLADAESFEEFQAGVEEALDQVAVNDFSERAVAIAALIADKDPHIVGLQEVYKFTSYAGLNGSPPFLDYLEELKAALSAQGACYEDVATVINLDFGPIPLPNYGPVSITDRDVIMARCGVEANVVNLKREYEYCIESEDGCNYNFVAQVEGPSPIGTIRFERGYVAVDTMYGRFFNTHLEVKDPDPGNPFSPLVQRIQAQELIQVIDSIPPHETGPVFVVGDINSSPEDEAYAGFLSPYQQLEYEGYVDAWTLRPGKPKGYTCCFEEDLSLPGDLYERIDVIFSDQIPNRVKANVLGNDEADKTASGLWPSDHAGVSARIIF